MLVLVQCLSGGRVGDVYTIIYSLDTQVIYGHLLLSR